LFVAPHALDPVVLIAFSIDCLYQDRNPDGKQWGCRPLDPGRLYSRGPTRALRMSGGIMQRFVVVGGGVAGHRAVVELARRAPNATIDIVSEEPCLPYDR